MGKSAKKKIKVLREKGAVAKKGWRERSRKERWKGSAGLGSRGC